MHSNSPSDLILEQCGYRLTTVEILYYLPDFPVLLQTFIWQNLDLSPDFPRLHAFLRFWEHNIDARLYRVNITQALTTEVSSPRVAKEEFTLH